MRHQFIPPMDGVPYRQINRILNQALLAVDPQVCVEETIRVEDSYIYVNKNQYSFSEINKIVLLGVGKAVLAMANGVVNRLQSFPIQGHLISKHLDEYLLKNLPGGISISIGDHPIPTKRSINAARKMLESTRNIQEKTLVINLISGGGSSLMTLPAEGIKLDHIQELTQKLLRSGAAIEEINIIRKHLDLLKGGGLMREIYPARSLSLILSDVLGDNISAIASGPTAPDLSTFQDAKNVIKKYRLEKSVNPTILDHIEKGIMGEIPETIKPWDRVLSRHVNCLIASLKTAANEAILEANRQGFITELISVQIVGEAREVGRQLSGLMKKTIMDKRRESPICLVAGGEPTVTIQGGGKGGRSQEVALSAALELSESEKCIFIALATDGEDGPTDAAGAFVNGATIKFGEELGMDAMEYLNNNDSYNYLDSTRSLIRIGPTGTNVNDLYLMIAY